MINHLSFFESILMRLANRIEKYEVKYIAFGIFCVVNYMLPMYTVAHGHFENAFIQTLRVTAVALGFFLAVYDAWHKPLKKHFPWYWYFTITYCLPFMTTYMILVNGVSVWIINIIPAMTIGLLLLDILSFSITFALGMTLAIITYWVQSSYFTL
jgi:hypothetical protein